jgi:hypothetical protein
MFLLYASSRIECIAFESDNSDIDRSGNFI